MTSECFVRAGIQQCSHANKSAVDLCEDCDTCADIEPSARV